MEFGGWGGGVSVNCALLTLRFLLSCRLSQARAMLGQSTWPRSKSTKPTSVATTIKPGLWSSRLQREINVLWGNKPSGRSSGRAGQSWPSHTASSSHPSHQVFHKLLRLTVLFPFLYCFCLACYLLDSVGFDLVSKGVSETCVLWLLLNIFKFVMSGLRWGSLFEFDLIAKSRCQLNLHCPLMCGVVPPFC